MQASLRNKFLKKLYKTMNFYLHTNITEYPYSIYHIIVYLGNHVFSVQES